MAVGVGVKKPTHQGQAYACAAFTIPRPTPAFASAARGKTYGTYNAVQTKRIHERVGRRDVSRGVAKKRFASCPAACGVVQ